ncbi:hypothetical protein [Nonomuraea sp. NPDC050310]|uniref:hypothetical protein n=1 Tax=Nonomuraea sp. NPDC050310 TaxID=3154935 RepID=UPI0033DEEF44
MIIRTDDEKRRLQVLATENLLPLQRRPDLPLMIWEIGHVWKPVDGHDPVLAGHPDDDGRIPQRETWAVRAWAAAMGLPSPAWELAQNSHHGEGVFLTRGTYEGSQVYLSATLDAEPRKPRAASPTVYRRPDHQFTALAGGVEDLEAIGMSQLLACDVIPARLVGIDEWGLAGLGFELGDLVDGDPLFRYACLPEGWTRKPSDGPRTGYLVDERGQRRAVLWYKAAPYDRRATLTLLAFPEREAL